MSAPKIAILHYSSAPVVGGVESVMREHSRLFAHAGYPVTIFSGRGSQVDEDIQFHSFSLLNSSDPRILRIKEELDKGNIPADFETAKEEILAFLDQELITFDTIFAHNICSLHKNLPLTAALHTFLGQHQNTKLVSWDHDLAWVNGQYRPQLYDAYPWHLLKQTWDAERHTHVTVSEMRKKELEQLLGEDAPSVRAIPSGIDWRSLLHLGKQALDIIAQYHLMNAFPVLFLPARITRRKNIEQAIAIMQALRDHYPACALVISGPLGPHNPKNKAYFEELKQISRQHGLDRPRDKGAAKVIFLADYTDDFLPMRTIYDLFRFTDALLFPSLQEGFGIPILEAGLANMPIFCSDIPPFHETAGGKAHYFDPAGDPHQIARQMHAIISTSNTLAHKKHVRQNYTWNNIFIQQIEPLVLSQKRKRD